MSEEIAGHPILNPEGVEIRVPAFAFRKLRALGLLGGKDRKTGLRLISKRIYVLLDGAFDCLTDGLSRLLGRDCSGPQWVICRCRKCHQVEEDLDDEHMPHNMVNRDEREGAKS